MSKLSRKQNKSAAEVRIKQGRSESSRRLDIAVILRKPLIHILLITIVGFFAYSNTFHSPFQWDEKSEIIDNPLMKDPGNFISDARGYDYNPRRFIGYLTFVLNYHIGGLNVTGYHIVNLVIHITNALLVYVLVTLTFRTPYFVSGGRGGVTPPLHDSRFTVHDSRFPLIALFSALFFVSHPIQTQAVTYVIQRLASLAALFYLLSVVLYIKGRLKSLSAESGVHGAIENAKNAMPFALSPLLFYMLSIVSAVLAMKTKEITFTLPLVIVLYEFTFFRSSLRKKLLFLLPVILTLIIIPLSVLHSDKPLGEILSDLSEKTRVQTNISRGDYVMTEMRVITTYIRLLFFPVNQNLDYDYPVYHSFLTPPVFLSLLFLLAIFGTAVYLLYRSRGPMHAASVNPPPPPFRNGGMGGFESTGLSDTRNAADPCSQVATHDSRFTIHGLYRLIAFGILWFFITLSVESSIIPIADVIFEHRLYLPSVGLLTAITAGVFFLMNRLRGEKAVMPALVLTIVAFACLTYARNIEWKNDISLWQDVVQKSSNKERPHNNLGFAYYMENRLDDALREYQTALKLEPDFADAHNNLANLYYKQGHMDEAIEEFETAVKLKPNYVRAHSNLAAAYSIKGRLDDALREYQTALKLNPNFADTHNNLGSFYYRQGRLDEAVKEYQTALKLNPDDTGAHNNLGTIYYQKGRADEAIGEYQAALKINPDDADAHNNMGTVYAKQGRLDEAVREYQTALKFNPDHSDARNNLKSVYDRLGRPDEAALKLNPDNADDHNNLGKFYGKQGRLDEALREFQTALKLKPDFADAHNGLGNVLGLQGRPDEAIKEYQIALKLKPDFADAHNNLGTVYYRQGHMDAALKEYQTALRLKPDDPGVHNNLGTIYYQKGRMDAALKEYQTALKLKPDDQDARNNLEILNKRRSKK